jgi:hypothetical protein
VPDTQGPTHERVPILFREVNEEIVRLAQHAANADGVFAVLCECGDPSCLAHIKISRESYRLAREAPERFVYRAGHEPDGVTVIASVDGYVVAEE